MPLIAICIFTAKVVITFPTILTFAGNIRPHVVSLLFRSLVSLSDRCASAAHSALREVMTGGEHAIIGAHRLSKDLLQTSIRPVLLNLRDYTKLTVQLLKGLSRLLSLLASWFNKTLGEKLIEHLRKWEDPKGIVAQGVWAPGDEPLVAAEIISLFEKMPQGRVFVEQVVTSTIRLESVLPQYSNFVGVESPFRAPLTRFFNKHCSDVADFFLNPGHLGNAGE